MTTHLTKVIKEGAERGQFSLAQVLTARNTLVEIHALLNEKPLPRRTTIQEALCIVDEAKGLQTLIQSLTDTEAAFFGEKPSTIVFS